MIDRVGLESLTPAKRAEVIYGAAQAEMSRRLWQAALGDSSNDNGGNGGDDRRASALSPRARGDDPLEALMASLLRNADSPGVMRGPASADAAQPSAIPAPATPPPLATPMSTPMSTEALSTISLAGLGPNGRFAGALAAAADRVGVPATALAAIVDAEAGKAGDGSWKIYSRNPRSSAAGLGQFLNRTWEGLAETRGTWLNDFAKRQGWLGPEGQVRAESRAAMLATRYDPTAAINGIADYARRNLDGLDRAGVAGDGGVKTTARMAYLAHHLGLGDAVRFLRGHGLSEERAKVLLDAQVGTAGSSRRIAAATGDATAAHRQWLVGYLDRHVRPDRFQRQVDV